MKNRVLLAMLIIFIVLATVWMACGTIFIVRDIVIIDETVQAADPLTETEKNQIIKESGLLGKNILFNLNEETIAKNIKSYNPMLKLHSAKAEFPSGVILKISRRSPIYCMQKDSETIYFDAEMCLVENTQSIECIDISGTNLELANSNLSVGDVVTGKEKKDQAKIEQLTTIASYFDDLSGFDITYDDTAGYENFTILVMKINPDVTFKITIDLHNDENFFKALDYTNQFYKDKNNLPGEYITVYRNNIPETKWE
ncbi:MAG: FtsQ-type POTRA domain-containing protein [Clostridia bacterium]|nr:FtsQ-type POTRA domain-containing protein [Clostridia bacterium]